MEKHNHGHAHSADGAVANWRTYRGLSGCMLCGLLLAGVDDFWLTTNLTVHDKNLQFWNFVNHSPSGLSENHSFRSYGS